MAQLTKRADAWREETRGPEASDRLEEDEERKEEEEEEEDDYYEDNFGE